jgi:membrane fusion protein, multidrug efflux system
MSDSNTSPAPALRQTTAPAPKSSAGRLIALAVAGVGLAVGFHRGLDYFVTILGHESTDDAFLDASMVAVSSRLAGPVQAVHVRDNQWVKRGDALVELDPRDFEMRRAQKRAASASAGAGLDSAKAGLDFMRARLATAEATSRQEQANVESSRAKAQRAQADLKRVESLRQTGVVSVEELDRARADADSAAADLKSAEQKAAAAASQIAEAQSQIGLAATMVASADTKIQQARTDEQAADLDLSYVRIAAPFDGRVTRKAVELGAYVQVGQSLCALVTSNYWVVANFKESELTHMRPGQAAEILIDAHPQRWWRGHVDSIQAGSGARFSLLPPENAVGNYVKVVQRVPVKIVFDEAPDPAMSLGPGMSVVPRVRINDFAVSGGIIWLVALVLAVLATLGLARVMAHFRD